MDMLASFLASNYAFYSSVGGGTQPVMFPNMVYAPTMFHPTTLPPNVPKPKKVTSTSCTSPSCSQSPAQSPKSPNAVKFSIDSILGKKEVEELSKCKQVEKKEDDYNAMNFDADSNDALRFPWLHCTRYKPPKLQSLTQSWLLQPTEKQYTIFYGLKKKENTKKRKLGRNPRVPFTQHQVGVLEQKFRGTHYLSSMDVADLSASLNLTETRVKIWFQNRRARERRERESKQRAQGQSLPKTLPTIAVPRAHWNFPSAAPGPAATASASKFQDAVQIGKSAFTPVQTSTGT